MKNRRAVKFWRKRFIKERKGDESVRSFIGRILEEPFPYLISLFSLGSLAHKLKISVRATSKLVREQKLRAQFVHPYFGNLWPPDVFDVLEPHAAKLRPTDYIPLSSFQIDPELAISCQIHARRRCSGEEFLRLECQRLGIKIRHFLHGREQAPYILRIDARHLKVATSQGYQLERLLTEQDTTADADRRRTWEENSRVNRQSREIRHAKERLRQLKNQKSVEVNKQQSQF